MITNLKKSPDFTHIASIQWDSSWPELVKDHERHQLFSYLEERFGIPEPIFDDYLMFKRKKSWLIFKKVPHITFASQLKISKVGMKAFQSIGTFVKPATRMIQKFGHTATKGRLEINKEQLLRLLAGQHIPIQFDFDDGYVILYFRKQLILGLGLFINGKVRSQIPRKELREIMVKEIPMA